jgi:hypothetical protein
VSGSVIAVAVRWGAVAIEERVGLGLVFVCAVCHVGVGVVTFIQGCAHVGHGHGRSGRLAGWHQASMRRAGLTITWHIGY